MTKKDSIIKILEDSFKKSGYEKVTLNYDNTSKFYDIQLEGIHSVSILCLIRSITNSGWRDKPLIKRVQITKVDPQKLPISNFSKTAMIIGYLPIVDKHMFVLWSIYNNLSHNTNKSCYVRMEKLFNAYIYGYYIGMDSDQKIWISDENNLSKIIYDYLKTNEIRAEHKE